MIKLEPHRKDWINIFKLESQKLKNIFGSNYLKIHHIGSTSIPELYAKPIIDIIVVVKDLKQVDNYNESMAGLGYKAKGEYGFFMRRFFVKENAFHVHVFEKDNSEIDRHLKFRDWLLFIQKIEIVINSLRKT